MLDGDKTGLKDGDKSQNKIALEVYAPEAEVVRRIFRELANGSTATQLVVALTREGLPAHGLSDKAPTVLWAASTIGRIVRNDAYQGIA